MVQTESARIGFIGLGNLGGRIANRLAELGWQLIVHDVNDQLVNRFVQQGALSAPSPAEIASKADIVIVCLPTPEIVHRVVCGENGLIEGKLAEGYGMKIYIDLSTTGPAVSTQVAEVLAKHGVAVIDAPVSGGIYAAEKGTLSIMAAGPKEIVDACRPILEAAGKIFYLGNTIGQGQTMKLINNLLSATAYVASAEAMVLGVKAGLDPDLMVEIVNASSGRNSATEDKIPRAVLTRRFDIGFTTGLLNKDVRLCLEIAHMIGVPMWSGSAVHQILNFAVSQGGESKDMTTIIQHMEQWADVEVKSKA